VAGPFTSQKLRRLAAAGKLRPSDLVRSERNAWVRAARFKGLEFGDTDSQTATVISRPAHDASPSVEMNGRVVDNACNKVRGSILSKAEQY